MPTLTSFPFPVTIEKDSTQRTVPLNMGIFAASVVGLIVAVGGSRWSPPAHPKGPAHIRVRTGRNGESSSEEGGLVHPYGPLAEEDELGQPEAAFAMEEVPLFEMPLLRRKRQDWCPPCHTDRKTNMVTSHLKGQRWAHDVGFRSGKEGRCHHACWLPFLPFRPRPLISV